MLALRYVALYCARLLRRVIKIKGALCLDIVVTPLAQRVVGANQDLGASAGELCGGELLFIVFFVCGRKL